MSISTANVSVSNVMFLIPFDEIYGGGLGTNIPVTPQEPEGPTVPTTVEEAKAKWESSTSKKPPISNPAAPSAKSSNGTISLDALLSDAVK